jgi:hypothetical protein
MRFWLVSQTAGGRASNGCGNVSGRFDLQVVARPRYQLQRRIPDRAL